MSKEPTNLYLNELNELLVRILKAYDMKTDNRELLLVLAERLSEWIRSLSKETADRLLYFQILRRKRPLTPEERSDIHAFVDDADDDYTRCYCFILLDDKHNSMIYYNRLTDDEKAHIAEDSISGLMVWGE